MPPEKPASDESMISMNTMPDAPSSPERGNSTHCSTPVTRAVNTMPHKSGLLPYFFFHWRANNEQQQHVIQKVIPAGMAQHMAEQPDVEQRVLQRGAVDTEQMHRRPPVRPLVEEQHQK